MKHWKGWHRPIVLVQGTVVNILTENKKQLRLLRVLRARTVGRERGCRSTKKVNEETERELRVGGR